MIRVGSIVLRVDDLQRQTEFWEAALDYVRRESDSGDFVLLRPRDGTGPNVSLDQVARRCRSLRPSPSTRTPTIKRARASAFSPWGPPKCTWTNGRQDRVS